MSAVPCCAASARGPRGMCAFRGSGSVQMLLRPEVRDVPLIISAPVDRFLLRTRVISVAGRSSSCGTSPRFLTAACKALRSLPQAHLQLQLPLSYWAARWCSLSTQPRCVLACAAPPPSSVFVRGPPLGPLQGAAEAAVQLKPESGRVSSPRSPPLGLPFPTRSAVLLGLHSARVTEVPRLRSGF